MELILSLWPVAAFVAVVWYIALFEADKDAFAIEAHLKIDHAAGWCRRALGIMVPAGIVCLALPSWLCILPLLTIGAFLFSAVFRYRLNSLRGLHPCYVSPSNYYDRFFIVVTGVDKKKPCQTWVLPGYSTPGYPLRRLRAGRLAYITESTLVALSIYAVGVIQASH